MNKTTLLRWALILVLGFLGTVAIILLIGDDNPLAPLSFAEWILVKVIGLALALATFILGAAAHHWIGLFELDDEEPQEKSQRPARRKH